MLCNKRDTKGLKAFTEVSAFIIVQTTTDYVGGVAKDLAKGR